MPIGISDDHAELGAALRAWARDQRTTEVVRTAEGDPARLAEWSRRAAEMGLPSVALPAPTGGGGSLLDQGVALEAAAYGLVPGGLLSTTAAGLVVDDADLRAGIASGKVSVGVGLRPSLMVEEGRLHGSVAVVADAGTATHLLLGAAERWFVVPADRVALEAGCTPDLSRTVATVQVDDVCVTDVLEVELDAALLRRTLLVLGAAEAAGVAQWCLDTAVAYAGVREQFGRKIGGFQAIKHLCAEMLETTESVTAAAWDAAASAGADPDQHRLAVLVAGVTCLEGAVAVAKSCIQVLGGIGFTFEHDAHLYLRRALALRSLLGPVDEHAAGLAALACAGVRRQPSVDVEGREELRSRVGTQARRIAGLPAGEQRAELARTGYLVPHWPRPWGLGADPAEQLVIDEELAVAGVQRPDLKIGAWAAPTIIAHGRPEQQERFVGPTLTGDLVWCQLFSEPGAGSDLASLRTKAVREEGGWRLTGQKVWTSLAHEADWGICLARTSPLTEAGDKPHAGITYFLVDMRSDGIEVRPLREMTGEAMFNEVFLDAVFVPDECVVGAEGGGWKLARTTLANERVAMAGARLGDSVERAITLAEEGDVAVGRAVALATVVKLLGARATLRSIAGRAPGAESSVAKLLGVRSRQESADLVVTLLGDRLFTGDGLAGEAMHELLLTRCLSIAGGTTQVLRNVVGERILGLPRG